jgi:hypothetical protein
MGEGQTAVLWPWCSLTMPTSFLILPFSLQEIEVIPLSLNVDWT